MKKIAIITATRAEYGLFRPIIREIEANSDLEYSLIVTGMHLSPEFGMTINDIERDGVLISHKIEILNREDTGAGMARYLGELQVQLSRFWEKDCPDCVLLLGDRGEMLAGAIVATLMNIAVFHIHGGEFTGSVDDLFRHAITKLAHLHLVASEQSKNNIINIGEHSELIHVVGAPGLDNITELLPDKDAIAGKFDLDLSKPVILMIQHPVTTEAIHAKEQIETTLKVLEHLKEQTVIVYPNADSGGRVMIDSIQKYLNSCKFMKGFKSLPRSDYLGLMSITSVMIGNSSSGIIEAPFFDIPVVNIGTRQKGRQQAINVLNTGYDFQQIIKAIKKALNDEDFRNTLKDGKNPYGDGKSSQRIVEIIKTLKFDAEFLQKRVRV